MKLSIYAKKMGISYRTAWNWFKSGKLKGVQMPSGTIITEDENNKDIIKELKESNKKTKSNEICQKEIKETKTK